MLDKRLQLGGLQVGGPRTMQNSARFRVADNVYQTLDEYMVPRFGNEDYLTGFDSDELIIAVANYKLKPFIITRTGDDKFHFYYDSLTELPTPVYQATVVNPNPDDLLSLGIQFVESQGCLFFNMPILGLLKFDGFQVFRAGVPTPWISSLQYNSAGTTFIRVIGHHLDLQGNVINSGYVQFPATPVGNNVTIQTDQSALDMVGTYFGFAFDGVTPKGRQVFDNLGNSHDSFFMVASAVASSNAAGVTYTTGGNHNVEVGCYLFVKTAYETSVLSGFGVEVLATVFKVSAKTATTVTLQYADAKYLDTNRNWQTTTAVGGLPAGAATLANQWLSVWTSNAATGNYVWKAIIPAPFLATTAQNSVVNVSSPTVAVTGSDKNAFNLAGNLGDIYDVTSFKFPFPCFMEDLCSLSFCSYGSMAVISQANELFFSDTSLGGSFEMTSGIAFAVVGGGDDGPVQAVQATPDFLFVSRQFKNYYVAGNLPTANYRVQPISQTSLGAYSNETTVACLDKILFVNKAGVWALYAGGRCEEVSFNVRGLFTTFSDTKVYPEELLWDVDDFPTYLTPTQWFDGDTTQAFNKWMRVRFDNCRNLVIIFVAGDDGSGSALVINMNNGELYTWNEFLYGETDPDLKDVCFIEGNYYLASNWATDHTVRKEAKSGVNKYDYSAGDNPPRLITTWFTAGEPSLEKKTKQLKMWGAVYDGTVDITQFLDWKPAETTVGTYTNDTDVDLFSHKQRLNPANALALSVSMAFRCSRMELEGLELEFEPFQMGMKR